jgi:hypothetical protein
VNRRSPAFAVALVLLLCACSGPSSPTSSPVATTAPPSGSAPTSVPAAVTTTKTASSASAPAAIAYPAPGSPQATAYPGPSASTAEVPWVADGVIGDKEYSGKATVGPVTLSWRNDAKFLFLAMEGKTKGWLAVGLDPVDRMMGANYIQGWYDGQPHMQDQYGTTPTGPAHPEDTTLGGTSDIVAYAVVEVGGVTRCEAQIPLDSGDSWDKPLKPGGTYTAIVAMGVSDVPSSPHVFAGTTRITLAPAP